MRYKERDVYSWIIFLIWPFFMFVYSFKDFFHKNSQRIFLAFSFLYGYSVFISSGDITRYEDAFYHMRTLTWDQFFWLLTNFWTDKNDIYFELNLTASKPDIYALTSTFIVGRFTENPRWFWGIISVIYTYLILNFINTIANETNIYKNLFNQKVFLFGLILIIPFYYGITGVRFWPALFIYVTYALQYLSTKKNKFIFIAGLSIFFHYSFLLPFFLLIVTAFLPNNRSFYKMMVIGGIFISVVSSVSSSLTTVENITSVFEETAIDDSTSSYTDEGALEIKKEKFSNVNWYVQLRNSSVLYFLIILALFDVFGLFGFKENKFLITTYPLMVIFLTLTLLTIELGSLARFRFVFYILILSRYVILCGLQPNNKILNSIALFFVPFLTFYTIIVFRGGFYTVDPLLLINNAFLTFFINSDVSLSEFLVGH